MTYGAFYNAMVSLPENHENRDLEEYLLALFSLVKKHEKEPFSPELCIEIIQKAFTETPMSFDEKWLSVCDAPDEGKGMDFTQNVLIFQIAELHRMRDKELQNPQRYSGINSETDIGGIILTLLLIWNVVQNGFWIVLIVRKMIFLQTGDF